ncbi:protein kintoun isoform X2 [Hyposmocoma kahamanoa]|uniref:protein kintoun isoform X2 n=1 Tax=Hyposmocoma kahamanoa TaxID=1477025 RepID=UPI000E6D8990|nr:protein kintoun isoform X2 [Hyposmocoma kahamanoa]
MATGVPPRDDEPSLSRIDLENIQEAMKQKKFRDLLAEYCEEVRDPANQAIYQKEMTQLEKERGNVQIVDGKKGMNWQVPYSLVPPREDYNDKRERCVIYDVVFHPDTLRMAYANNEFRNLVNKTAIEGLAKTYNIHLDSNNCRFPKSQYKGFAVPSVIRTEDPNYKPPTDEDVRELTPEILEKLYPQKSYAGMSPESKDARIALKNSQLEQPKPKIASSALPQARRTLMRDKNEFTHATENGYTIPKYVIKQQKAIDLQDFTYNKDCKQYSAIPNCIVVEINLPLLSSTKDCTLDVKEKSLSIKSESPAKYKLDVSLPYYVNEECGNAKFDKKRHMLIVTLPVMRKHVTPMNECSSKIDSGVESEENSGSQSDEENSRENLIVELPSAPVESTAQQVQLPESTFKTETFLNPSLGYSLPPYTHNVLDDVIAFTFHVKNTEPESVIVKKDGNKILIKFTSVGSGYVPVHYAAILAFDESVTFENVSGEAWDNNVILQMELNGYAPQKFKIGICEDSMLIEEFDVSEIKKTSKVFATTNSIAAQEGEPSPVVEVTNLGSETNIVVSSNNSDELDEDDDDVNSPILKDEDYKEEIVWTDTGNSENGAKGILRKPPTMRSFSESSVDFASSMDYISSDCIPEEFSLKKTVRFNDVIARQFYRYNSSIEGQKKKNQRKKSKKRNQEQRKSESEAEDEVFNLSKTTRPKLKSAIKLRRDSGLADTSDAEVDCKNESRDHETTLDMSKMSHGFEEQSNENLRSVLNIVDNTDEEAKEYDVKSEMLSDNTNDENKQYSTEGKNDNRVRETTKSVLNIINNKSAANEKAEPAIWESEASIPPNPDTKNEEKKETSCESITCDSIKHKTNLYDPSKLNKGHYLEVKFKNDLIFDLDM